LVVATDDEEISSLSGGLKPLGGGRSLTAGVVGGVRVSSAIWGDWTVAAAVAGNSWIPDVETIADLAVGDAVAVGAGSWAWAFGLAAEDDAVIA
jgi:hypothetical protein